MSKWLREPLLHFILLGAGIFALYGMLAGESRAPDEIYISRGQQENLLNTFNRTWQRPATPQEFQGLLQDYIRQEIAYRESREIGLDQDDIVIRRRLRQKLELLAEDVASLVQPTDQELQAYLDDNSEDFRLEPSYSLSQLYFSVDRRGEQAAADAIAALGQLQDSGPMLDGELPGDPLPLPEMLEDAGASEVARLFGEVFVTQMGELPLGEWAGPVESGYGLHLVYVQDSTAGRAPALDEVRHDVQREWLSQRRREAIDAMYERLLKNYDVEIESLLDEPASNGDQAATTGQ